MNKILFLKILIGIMTTLLAFGMIGMIYGLLFYKKSPKTATVPSISAPVGQSQEIYLNQNKNAEISEIKPCGEFLCILIKSDFEKSKIAILSPKTQKIIGWVFVGSPETSANTNQAVQ